MAVDVPEPIAPVAIPVASVPGAVTPNNPKAGPASAPPVSAPSAIGMAFSMNLSNEEDLSPKLITVLRPSGAVI